MGTAQPVLKKLTEDLRTLHKRTVQLDDEICDADSEPWPCDTEKVLRAAYQQEGVII
jgi:hypothetical protein